MRHVPLTIGSLLAAIVDLQAKSAYVHSYRRSKKLLEAIDEVSIDADTVCRALITSARSAYYVSRFDECTRLLDRCAGELPKTSETTRRELEIEAALVRANLLRRIGRYIEALELLSGISEGCVSVEEAERLLVVGACHYYLKNLDESDEALETALGLATHLADDRLRSRVLAMMGLAAQGKGHLASAEEYLSRAKGLCHGNSDAYGEACAGLNLGIVLYRRGRFEGATSSIDKARSIFNDIEWSLGECRALLARGNIEKFQRKIGMARRYYRRALRIAREGDFARERALAHEFLGELQAMKGRFDSALEQYTKSLELARSLGPARDIEVEVRRRIGELHLDHGEPDEALVLLDRGLKLAREIGDRLEEGAILRAIGLACVRSGDRVRSRVCFEKALDVLRSAGARYEIAMTYLRSVDSLFFEQRADTCRDPRPLPAADAGALDEAWGMLVEASHLFSESGAVYWKKRTIKLLSGLEPFRRRHIGENEICTVGNSCVRLTHNDAYLLHEGFVCVSDAMRMVENRVGFSARCSRPVLIMGETGTGKEVVARLIHDRSDRSGRSFVAVNCAAIPDHLFESEFFGHRRGCFTGAVTDRKGIFEEAHGGTLFLDEIGELTTLQQVKLLRVLQEGKVRRIGENSERLVDIRVISATNQDINGKLEDASLREDFYYRINAEQIHIPPLRERREDIIPLITYYLCGSNGSGRGYVLIEEAALRCLQGYSWPGNIRELFNLLERLGDMSGDDPIDLGMLPEHIRNGTRRPRGVSVLATDSSEGSVPERLERALSLCGGNKSAAARFLGISRGTLYKELRRFGLGDYIRPSATP